MHAIFTDVNEAFTQLVLGIARRTIPTVKTSSRVGDVLQIPEPVIITYQKPLQRVLFNPERDCNPFFHLYESLWMLAGRSDIAPLDYYSSNYSKQVQDGDFPDANGAYGFRWRSAMTRVPTEMENRTDLFNEGIHDHLTVIGDQPYFDQLGLILDHLRKNPNSRRAVLQMWTVADDLLKVDKTKDVCCNVCAFFSIRKDYSSEGHFASDVPPYDYLDMTVVNRSNDIIWGMLGANVVHFSFLQEYLANCLGVEVGVYNQFSNNAHVYTERFFPEKWIKPRKPEAAMTMWDDEPDPTPYERREGYNTVPLVRDKETFDEEVQEFVEHNGEKFAGSFRAFLRPWEEPFLELVAKPMCNAFHCYKMRKVCKDPNNAWNEAFVWASQIQADDWRRAGTEWMERRKAKAEGKGELNG